MHTTTDIHLKLTSVITGWKSVDDAPWDAGPLYAAAGKNVRVFGLVSNRKDVDGWLPYAQQAASYDTAVLNVNNTSSVADYQLRGFAAFIAPDSANFSKWFAGAVPANRQPSDTPGVTWSLRAVNSTPGLIGTPDEAASYTDRPAGLPGGSGVVVYPLATSNALTHYNPADSPDTILAHEFVHAYFGSSYGYSSDDTNKSVTPLATAEGIAELVTYSYRFRSSPSDTLKVDALIAHLRELGLPAPTQLPTDDQLRGPRGNDYYAQAASFWAYLAQSGQDPFETAVSSYQNNDSPLLEVGATPGQKSDPKKVLAGWRAWYQRNVG